MPKKYTHDELVGLVKSPGWKLVPDNDDEHVEGTLEDVLKASHEKHKAGDRPGLIKQIETAIELEMIEIEKLWFYLGLPH
jgi:hypothetical protein